MKRRRYVFPRVEKPDVIFEFADELTIDTGTETYVVSADPLGVWVSCGPTSDDITGDPVGKIADLIGCTTEQVEPMVRQHFSERFGWNSAVSVERAILAALPGLAELAERNPTLRIPMKLSLRLREALRNADPRDASRAYFQDESSRSDGQAFAVALQNGDQVDESRASLLALVEVGDLRREVSNTRSAVHWVTLPSSISAITSTISPRAQVDFTATAIASGRSRFALAAANRCGITAHGYDGAAAYFRVLSEVQCSEFAAPRTIVERLINGGPVAGLAVRKAPPVQRELKALGSATRTCLGNPAHPWLDRIVRGEVELVLLSDEADEIVGIVAIGPNGDIREARSPGNGPVPPDVLASLREAVRVRA